MRHVKLQNFTRDYLTNWKIDRDFLIENLLYLKCIKRDGHFLLNHFIVFWCDENNRLKTNPRSRWDAA